MNNFRDWAQVDTREKLEWKKPLKDALAFIGACTLIALMLIWASY
jgi:hypothetical protein